jgi:ketosteroid isomerase-like protein
MTRLRPLLAAAVLVLAGCSGVGGKSEEDKVKDVVNQFVAAGNARDFAKVCDLLTEQMRAVQGGKQCEANFKTRAGGAKSHTQIEITDVRISGTQAAVDAKLRNGKNPASEQQLLLQKQHGEWRVATAQ